VRPGTPLAFTQFSGAGSITAGDGLTQSGSTINLGNNGTGTFSGLTIGANTVAVALQAAGSGTGGLAFASNEIRIAIDGTSTGTAASVLQLNANGIAINVDDSTIEGSAAGGSLRVKDLGITTGKLAANAVTIAKMDIKFLDSGDVAASSFTNANPSTYDLAETAILGAQSDFFAECYRNGLADMTNVGNGGSLTDGQDFKIDNTGAGGVGRISIGANISATSNTYRIKYLALASDG
jgi:hypothetical protein